MKIYNIILKLYKNLIVCLLSALLLTVLFGYANAQQKLEYKVKAAFLYNFAKFVEWPGLKKADPSLPFVIGVLGDDPFGPELDNIQSKFIGGRRIAVKRFETIDNYEPCHILFVNFGEKNILKKMLLQIKNKNVLTVGDAEGFAKTGGMIGFIQKQNKIRFEINVTAAEQSDIKISSNLLKLATIVDTEKENGVIQ
jgi:YfiR/HmsC-like